MLPADLSTLASSLAKSEAAPVLRHALLSLAAASDRSNVTHMSLGRLADRLGVSRNHVQRIIRKGRSQMSHYCSCEEVPGRASRWVFRPENWRPNGVNTGSAGAAGGQRRRCTFLVLPQVNLLAAIRRPTPRGRRLASIRIGRNGKDNC